MPAGSRDDAAGGTGSVFDPVDGYARKGLRLARQRLFSREVPSPELPPTPSHPSMRLLRKVAIAVLLLAIAGGGTAIYLHRAWLETQWTIFSVGLAKNPDEARRPLARLDCPPDQATKLRELMARWGRGNEQFDLYLARYVDHPDSSEALREAFSGELSRRESLLPRWSGYWAWRSAAEPDAEIASMRSYLDVLLKAPPTRTLTWREVLDLQAAFQLTGQSEFARQLSPANWRQRYRQWLVDGEHPLPHVARPENPFAETAK